ncbi:poly-beta-1,6-N-acetyl-D-glucosamine N-deacetylase PgaB [Variovorax ginsengisoli]|uniref:Biofilm PGA synthesis lipoprotein PgaB n=1 Tax=Variovorax ginsengisoli TaxID=363844 RepID=A0ABT9S6B9_9BURK|nr:poly-beta-1,6-N-acetyl-D-glucosamine N-deacetylase PgaB [Variovorax ginsengisoli]MDP9898877.1 biofilm PGA synthesis lipoprotein PgaB [Variovorax ginsengisoli]
MSVHFLSSSLRWRLPALLFAAMLTLLCMAPSAHAQKVPAPDVDDGKTFRAIALHDIRSNVRESFETAPEATALDERTLAEFFSWLQANDHHPVSLQQIIDARAGGKPLPPRAVLLSFDDGYESAYTKAFPLLKRFGYPAVMALVTSWLDVPAGQPVTDYNPGSPPSRDSFLTWTQAREMAASGLVEFASHSDALHRGVPGNPQGNVQPAGTTLQFDAASGRYETVAAYVARVEADLRRSREVIEKNTASKVRAMVWPYGAYNREALRAADRAGMPITLTLDEGPNTADVPLQEIRRGLATYDMPVPYHALLRTPGRTGSIFPIHRAMHIDLDYVYDPDPAQQEANLSRLLERVLAVGPSAVYLQAFSDPDGDGVADALYFPNRHMPVRADLFNRVAWQLRTRTGVQVFAWMPVMAFHLPKDHPLAAHTVGWLDAQPRHDKPQAEGTRYARLTPFDPAVRALIGDIYEDLGRHAAFAGVLFHDDATLSDDEDTSPLALQTYARWGLPVDVAAIRADPALRARWSADKTRFLTDFTLELAQRVRDWQPGVLTARNLYARPVMEPASGEWFAQDYAQSLAAYDYTAVMAMPFMEQVADPQAWLATLARRVAATPRGLERTVFELQARDWRTGKPVPDSTLAAQWSLLHRMGARHLAYYPDDFFNDQPGLATVRNALSVRSSLLQPVAIEGAAR